MSDAVKTPADITRAMRLNDVERNQRLVVAESTLIGERAMSLFRLALFGMLGSTQIVYELGTRGRLETDARRLVAVAAYLAWAVGMFVGLRRAKPDVRKAFVFPFLTTPVDYAYMVWMDLCDLHEYGHISPIIAAVARAVVVAFAAARFSTIQVAWSVVLAAGSFLFVLVRGGAFDLRSAGFVCSSYLVLGMVIAWTSRRINTMFGEVRRRDNLSRFLPRQVVDRVLEQGEASLSPVQREVTLLFADIRGFTTLSEKLSPREVLELLDLQLGEMAGVVKDHQGVVNKFLGDGMLALWGAPDAVPDHPDLALVAALNMRAKLAELNAARVQLGQAPIRMGIGIHTGVVAAGMLGGADQHEYAVIGDAVNVAARVEGLTKEHDTDILVTERTWQLAGAKYAGRRIGETQVKGRSEPVILWSLRGPSQEDESGSESA